ncbi:hypothetical protein NXY16_11055 [Bacteroides thetaiotaomicron]|uniref:hypothetical protein n=1 Tax=Bacteroides thetaiotaomicron TaxID=818 RepID=UPI001CCE668F|nr:hypothetical protein [Bacteroides thetaiotaomicron]UBD13993.1 hypothetical protein K6V27_10535 [Bacteroides thetaiotaomicron]UVS27472.1 hypothetical protein NXY16_11055 [Bacteroides thetaiotaomicron]
MRKVLLLLPMMLITISCNHKQKEQTESPQTKTLTATEIRNQDIQDSLKQVKTDSLALIAWGDAKFGMTMKEVLATESFKGGDKYSNSIVMEHNRQQEFERVLGLNELWLIQCYFQENELTRIYIDSPNLTANRIDDLIRDCNIFIRNFTKKYGNPSYQKDKVNISEFNSGEEFEYAKYQIGDKTITILLGEQSREVKFYYKIYIENDKFPKKKHVQTEKEKKEEQRRMKAAKEIKENSF